MRNILSHLYEKRKLDEAHCIYHDDTTFPKAAQGARKIDLYVVAHGEGHRAFVSKDATVTLSAEKLACRLVDLGMPKDIPVRIKFACCYSSLGTPSSLRLKEKVLATVPKAKRYLDDSTGKSTPTFAREELAAAGLDAEEVQKVIRIRDEFIALMKQWQESLPSQKNDLVGNVPRSVMNNDLIGSVAMDVVRTLRFHDYQTVIAGGYDHEIDWRRKGKNTMHAPTAFKHAYPMKQTPYSHPTARRVFFNEQGPLKSGKHTTEPDVGPLVLAYFPFGFRVIPLDLKLIFPSLASAVFANLDKWRAKLPAYDSRYLDWYREHGLC